MNSKVIVVLVIVLLGVLAFHFTRPSEEGITPPSPENDAETMPREGEEPVTYNIQGELLDVTEGAEVRGVKTVETTTGTAMAGFANGNYQMEAVFTDLPDPVGDDFYEGWVVRRGDDFSVISTGALEKEGEGEYSNLFTSDSDLLDHDFYVLTLEPNDGDPAPADHILEGVME